MKKTLALSASFVALLAMASLSLKAAGKHNYDFSANGRVVRAVNPPAEVTPAPIVDSKYTVIASNLSAYPLGTFFSIFGNTVAQGGANYPCQTWVANAFTYAANAKVVAVQGVIGRLGSGSAGCEIGL